VRIPVLGDLRSLVERHDDELRRLVSQAARSGARTQDIAEAVGVSRSTLWRRYRAELMRGNVVDQQPG
jgi:transposase-like protein